MWVFVRVNYTCEMCVQFVLYWTIHNLFRTSNQRFVLSSTLNRHHLVSSYFTSYFRSYFGVQIMFARVKNVPKQAKKSIQQTRNIWNFGVQMMFAHVQKVPKQTKKSIQQSKYGIIVELINMWNYCGVFSRVNYMEFWSVQIICTVFHYCTNKNQKEF